METTDNEPREGFPLRIAALDVGSNAIRLTAGEFSDLEHFVELDSQRFAVRLGHDAFTTGRLEQHAVDGVVAAAVWFRRRLDDLGIAHYRAVATSAVRESRNGGELVERVRGESGIHLETITGSEEARLVWTAVRNRIAFDERWWILADLGGGSIELSVVNEEGIHWSESHPMGTVRLIEDLAGRDGEEGFRHLVERYAAGLSVPAEEARRFEGIVITGGNAEALANLAVPDALPTEPSEMDRSALRRTLDRLSAMTFRQRVDELGLREDRADVIVPAAILFDRVAELSGSDRIVVPRVGVQDGVLFDLASDLTEHRRREGEIERVATTGALALGRRYRFDEEHAVHVRELALSLFDQLAPVHGLAEGSRRRLGIAALLHDIGQFVSYRRHHKHSHYLILNSELPGLSASDIQRIALIARYHRRSEPKDYHEGYAGLPKSERAEIDRLAAMLRIADALDREHRRHIRSVVLTQRPGAVLLTLEGSGDTALEEWALRKKSAFFERVFGTELRIDRS